MLAPISFRIPRELRDRFDRVVEAGAVNKSKLFRQWIEEYTTKKEEELGLNKLYVCFSNDVIPRLDGKAVERIEEHNDHFYTLVEEDEAENTDDKQYAHYFARKEDDYDQEFYQYVTTKNAKP